MMLYRPEHFNLIKRKQDFTIRTRLGMNPHTVTGRLSVWLTQLDAP